MASGKRASMREGPLAALFRRTDEAGDLTADPAAPAEDARPEPREERRRRRRRPRAERAPRAEAAPRATTPPRPGRVHRGRPAPRARLPAPRPGLARRAAVRAAADPHPAGAPAPRVQLRDPGEHHGAAAPDGGAASRGVPPRAARPADPFAHERPRRRLGRGQARRPARAARRRRRRRRRQRRQPAWSRPRSWGVEFIAINTDVQSLQQSTADITLHIGPQVTRGLGAGSDPDLGRAGRDGGVRQDQGAAQGRGHGLHRRRLRRRHRHRRGADRRAHRPRDRRAHRRHRHQAVRLRGLAPRRRGRRRHPARWATRSTR